MTTNEVTGHAAPPPSFGLPQQVDGAYAIFPPSVAGCAVNDGNGTLHAFWGYAEHQPVMETPSTPVMRYLVGAPADVASGLAADGVPLAAAADDEHIYLLYSNRSGVHLTEVAADASFGLDRVLSVNPADQASLVVDQGGWWAVWVEDTKLCGAHGGWGAGDFPRHEVKSELADAEWYTSPSLALGPRDPAGPAARLIYLAWALTRSAHGPVVRLATRKVQSAAWTEQPWLPTPARPTDRVGAPALVYDGVLQGTYTREYIVEYMRDPSQSAAQQGLGPVTDFSAPVIAASAGQTVVAWVRSAGAGAELWTARPGSTALNLATGLAPSLRILGLTSYEGAATLLTFEDDHNVCLRTQTS